MPQLQIFLSYAREDATAAARLCDDLRAKNRKVWFDRDCLRGGQKWRPAINTAIQTSDFFLALLSGKSVTKRGMVQAEIKKALDVLDEMPEDRIYLIPVRLTECKPTYERLAELNWVDLFPRWEDGVAEILRSTDPDTGEPDLSDGPTPLDDLVGSMPTLPQRRKVASTPTRVSEAVREAIDLFRGYARLRNVDIRFEDAAPNASVGVNRQHLITAVANILNNAIKYSYTLPDKAAWVNVSAKETHRRVQLRVENWGVGISKDEVESGRIFQFGYRGRAAHVHSPSGTGMGLALTKSVCDEYNGSIELRSRPARSHAARPLGIRRFDGRAELHDQLSSNTF